jgi:hypothetical protein
MTMISALRSSPATDRWLHPREYGWKDREQEFWRVARTLEAGVGLNCTSSSVARLQHISEKGWKT